MQTSHRQALVNYPKECDDRDSAVISVLASPYKIFKVQQMSQGQEQRRNMFNCHYLWLSLRNWLLYQSLSNQPWLDTPWLNTEPWLKGGKKRTQNMIAGVDSVGWLSKNI